MNAFPRLALAIVAVTLCAACAGPAAKRQSSYEYERDNPLVHPPTQLEDAPAPMR